MRENEREKEWEMIYHLKEGNLFLIHLYIVIKDYFQWFQSSKKKRILKISRKKKDLQVRFVQLLDENHS